MDLDWILENRLAAMALPEEVELPHLRRLGVSLLVSLLEARPDTEAVRRAGLRHLRLPVENLCPPTAEQIREFVAETRAELARGGKVAVHCVGGVGRTGTLMACYLVSEGWEPQRAMDWVRRCRPGSIETEEQERAVEKWAEELS